MPLTHYARRLLGRLPYGGLFDRLYLFVIFAYAQRRLPRRDSRLLNDYFYFLKTSPALLDIFRQITSDKLMVKDFVKSRCGGDLTLNTLAVYEHVDEIDVSELSRPCVIKPAHSSGSVVFVADGQSKLSEQNRATLARSLQKSPYTEAREANYRFLRPRLIVEPMLPDGPDTKDYKVFCFGGVPRLIQVDSHRHTDHRRNLYSAGWDRIMEEYNYPAGAWEDAPKCLDAMMETARALSADFEFVRVDFFVSGERFFIGELTHCPESAHGRFRSREGEKRVSNILFQDVAPQ